MLLALKITMVVWCLQRFLKAAFDSGTIIDLAWNVANVVWVIVLTIWVFSNLK